MFNIKDFYAQNQMGVILQGGMGIGASLWRLARAVAIQPGCIGTVSGTAVGVVVARLLQDGDKDGSIKRALDNFPIPDMGKRVWDRYFVEGGINPPDTVDRKPYRSTPAISEKPTRGAIDLLIFANFVVVFLAKEGHDGIIGINYLEKVQTPHLASFFGAMLAKVDFVIAGAGLATAFPRAVDCLANFKLATYLLGLVPSGAEEMAFDPASVMDQPTFEALEIKKPACAGIVSTFAAAKALHVKSDERFDYFVVELPIAGGHNAPPRAKPMTLDELGQPVYNMAGKDNPELEKFSSLGRPFLLAGGFCSPEAMDEAISAGAIGVQVGTAFALSEESELDYVFRRRTIINIMGGNLKVDTSPRNSPTGFPFKTVVDKTSVSNQDVYERLERVCDIGYVRHAYRVNPEDPNDRRVGFRCPAETVDDFVRKGGDMSEAVGRRCVCRCLLAAIGLGQPNVPAIFTLGDDVSFMKHLAIDPTRLSYKASQVIDYIRGR